jgi:hypothetical protein
MDSNPLTDAGTNRNSNKTSPIEGGEREEEPIIIFINLSLVATIPDPRVYGITVSTSFWTDNRRRDPPNFHKNKP